MLLKATNQGRKLVHASIPPLQERFIQCFEKLEDWEQTPLLASLQRIAAMMDAGEIGASPVLSSGPITVTAGRDEVVDLHTIRELDA